MKIEPLPNMTVSEIVNAVRDGSLTIDPAGHAVNTNTERFLEHFDRITSLANGGNDGKWSDRDGMNVEEVDATMRQFHQRKLDILVRQEEGLRDSIDREFCFGCGEKIAWVLTGNKLQLRERIVTDPTVRFGIRMENYPVDYVCEFAEPKPFSGEIQVSSRLLFANFFRTILEDAPPGKKYTDEWSLCSLAGCKRITAYKAENQNVAYGQMGNMSIGIYVNEPKDCVIVGPCYHPAECGEFDSDEEYREAISKPIFEGFTKVGDICLDVWRWEATDLNTIGVDNYDALVEDRKYSGLVEIDVLPGTWQFEQHYRCNDHECDKDHIYAKLSLKRDA